MDKEIEPLQCQGTLKQSRQGMELYEEVLAKNFEIIDNFLKRFHTIFTKQQQFQQTILIFRQKLQGLQGQLSILKSQSFQKTSILEKKISELELIQKRQIRHSRQHEKIQLRPSKIVTPDKEQLEKCIKNKIEEKFNELNCELIKKQYSIQQAMEKISKNQTKLQQFCNITIKVLEQQDNSKKDQEFITKLSQTIQNKSSQYLMTATTNLQNKWNKQLQDKFKQQKQILQTIFENNLEQIPIFVADKIKDETTKIYEFKKSMEENLRNIVMESLELFANKQETKNSLLFLQKKLYRLSLTVNKNDHENNQIIDPALACKAMKCLSCEKKSTQPNCNNSFKAPNKPIISKIDNLKSSKNTTVESDSDKNFASLLQAFGHRRLVKSVRQLN